MHASFQRVRIIILLNIEYQFALEIMFPNDFDRKETRIVVSPDGGRQKGSFTNSDTFDSPISLIFDRKENRIIVQNHANEKAFIFDVEIKS